jgi:predicted permease
MWHGVIRTRLRALLLRVRFLLRRGTVERELDDEFRFHLERQIEENLELGYPPEEARRRALVGFGGVDRFKEQVRDGRGTRLLEDLAQDIRYAFRQLKRTPFFALVAVLTLTVGIGANTAVFSVLNGLLLKGHPYRAPETLVRVYSAVEGETPYGTSYTEDLDDLRGLANVFEGVGGFVGCSSRITEAGEARRVLAECVTGNLFGLVGIDMALGRGFTPGEDDLVGSAPVAVLGYALWQRLYGGDPNVLGTTLRLSGRPFTVIGVAPEAMESFAFQGMRSDVFVPMSMAETLDGGWRPAEGAARGRLGTKLIARLRSGTTVEQAQARADVLSSQLRHAYPRLYKGRSFRLISAQSVAIQPDLDAVLMTGGLLLMAAMGLVLLLVCTNLASFLLARGVDRRREIALRLAVGARRSRLVRQLLTETLTLGVLGAVGGVVLARGVLGWVKTIAPAMSLPVDVDTHMDGAVLAFTLGAVAAAGILSGLAPALRTTNPDLTPSLKGGRGAGERTSIPLRRGLVAVQVGASVVLLVAGGLFFRSLRATQKIDPGFSTRDAALLWVDLGLSGIPPSQRDATAQALKEQALALPGVEKVALSDGVQLSESTRQDGFTIPGLEPPPDRDSFLVYVLAVDAEYLDLMGIPVLEGRGVSMGDREGTTPVVVVSEAAARRFWPGEDPLGKRVDAEAGQGSFEVVGVARDTRVASLHGGPEPLFYFARDQYRRRATQLWLALRGSRPPPVTVGALRGLVRGVDPNLVVIQARSLEDLLASPLFLPRLAATLLGFLGLLAVAVASVGLFGMVSYDVSRRTREMGIRLSLGANRGDLVRQVLRDSARVAAAGAAVGCLASVGLARVAGIFLVGVRSFDPVIHGGVPLLLIAASILAAGVPAWRASRVSPARALSDDGG